MNPTQINRDYLIRYYPDSNYKHNPMLITMEIVVGIIARNETIDKVLQRLENNVNDNLTVRLDRGCTIVFISR